MVYNRKNGPNARLRTVRARGRKGLETMEKTKRKLLAGFLALLLALSTLTSCFGIQITGNGPQTDETEPPKPDVPETEAPETEAPETEVPVTVIPVNFTPEDLVAQNQVSNLLRWHESVLVRRQFDGGSETQSFWTRDGDRVFVDVSDYDDGENTYHSVSGSYRGFDFTAPSGEPVTATKWVTASEHTYDAWIDALVTDQIPSALSGDMVILAEDDSTYTVSLPETLVTEDGEEIPCSNTVVVNKGTLDLYSLDWEYVLDGVRNYGGITVEYDGEKLGEDILAEWDQTKRVNIDIATVTGGQRTEAFDYPVGWLLRMLPDEGITLSSPDALMEDGTVLVEATGMTVTVFAWDEANKPAVSTDPAPLDDLPFTPEELQEANRITNLLNRFGTLTVTAEASYGKETIGYFRFGDSIVRHSLSEYADGNGGTVTYEGGAMGAETFDPDPDGGWKYNARIPDLGDYLFTDTNADGEHYAYDLTLTNLLSFGEIRDAERTGDTVTFRYYYDFDDTGSETLTVTVDVSDASAPQIETMETGTGDDGMIMTLTRGGEIPFEKELNKAFEKTRTITCHYEEAGDAVYVLPADWSFTVSLYDNLAFYSDAAMTQQLPRPLPGDGKDYELWTATVLENVPGLEETEPDPLENYVGMWISETGASTLRISADGSFDFEWGGDEFFGTLVWTTEEKSLWANGGRYELVLDGGSVLDGDAFVSEYEGRLTLAQGGGAEMFRKSCLIRAEYPGEALPDCLEFAADRGEYAAKVLLTPEKALKDFTFFSLTEEDTADGSVGFKTVDLYKLADFRPEKPLLVTMTFGEVFPTYGFTYRGEDGVFRTYGIVQSGKDGSVLVTEISVALG